MKKANRIWLLAVIALSSLLLSACNINVERNDDGSLTATTNITAEELEQASEELEEVIEAVLSNDQAQAQTRDVDLTLQEDFTEQNPARANVINNQGNNENITQGSAAAPPPQPDDGPARQGAMPPGGLGAP